MTSRVLAAAVVFRRMLGLSRWANAFGVCVAMAPALLAACNPDPPLLSTPLPNGYSFESNGGEFGYIRDGGGRRMAGYFGLRDDGRETWCTDFAWDGEQVVCRLIEYAEVGFEAKRVEFFHLDTETGEIAIHPDEASAAAYWAERSPAPFPMLRRHHPTTGKAR